MRTKLTIFALSIAALAAAILGLAMSTRADSGLSSLDSRLALLPPDSQMVLAVDFEGIRRSDLYARYGEEKRAQMERDIPHLRTFIEETGLDPKRDIDSLLVSSRGKDEASFVGIVTGRFDTPRIEAALAKEHFAAEKLGRRTVFHLAPEAQGGDKPPFSGISIAFLGHEALVFGGREAVARTLKAADDPRATGFLSEQANRDLMAGVDTTGHVVGLVRTAEIMDEVSGALRHDGVPPALRSLQSVSALTFSVRADGDLAIDARAICKTAEDAQLVFDATKGLIAMGKLAAKDNDPDMAATFDLAQIRNEGSAITFSMKVPEATIEKWHEKLEQLHDSIPDDPPAAAVSPAA